MLAAVPMLTPQNDQMFSLFVGTSQSSVTVKSPGIAPSGKLCLMPTCGGSPSPVGVTNRRPPRISACPPCVHSVHPLPTVVPSGRSKKSANQ